MASLTRRSLLKAAPATALVAALAPLKLLPWAGAAKKTVKAVLIKWDAGHPETPFAPWPPAKGNRSGMIYAELRDLAMERFMWPVARTDEQIVDYHLWRPGVLSAEIVDVPL